MDDETEKAELDTTEEPQTEEPAEDAAAGNEETHDDISARVDALSEKADRILDIVSGFRDSLSAFVDNGGVVSEGDAEGGSVEVDTDGDGDVDLEVPIEDMDFSLDDDHDFE